MRLSVRIAPARPLGSGETRESETTMSAYICDHEHISYLVAAALEMARQTQSNAFRWTHPNGHTEELPPGDEARAQSVGLMLLAENTRSVQARYPRDAVDELPGDSAIMEDYRYEPPKMPRLAIDPVQVLKSIACFEYQACEHEGWAESEARAFLRSLERSAICALPGYEEAAWGAPAWKVSHR
jgi:hypothetical protein